MLQLSTVCQNNPLNLANILQVKNNTNNIKYSLYEGKYSGRKHMDHPVYRSQVHTVSVANKKSSWDLAYAQLFFDILGT